VGAVISVMIIRSGIEMISETLDKVLGTRADRETTGRIKQLLTEEPEVRGAYDLIINNYGPDKNYASVHLELPDTMTVAQLDDLTRRVETKVYRETGVILACVGAYSYNTGDNEAARIQNDVRKRVLSHDWAVQMHGFYLQEEKKHMRFDVVFSFDIDPKDGLASLYDEIRQAYPDYAVVIVPDVDVSD